jgi:hypothetical protein
MFFVLLKKIIIILAKYVEACKFGGGQLFVTLFTIFVGVFFCVIAPLNFTLGTRYSLEIVNYSNFYYIIIFLLGVIFTCCFIVTLVVGRLNIKNQNKKVYYFKPFYFVLVLVITLFIFISIFAFEAFYYALPAADGVYESAVIFNTFKLHKLVVITDSHPFYLEIKQFIQPKGSNYGFYSFDVLPPNTKYSSEYNSYLSSDVDALINRLEKEREATRLKLEREYHTKMIRRIGISLTIGLWIVGLLLKNC